MKPALAATLCAFATALSSGVAAQTSEPKRAAAGLINEGNQLLLAGDYEAALARYEAAHSIYPTPKIFFNMAEASRELGRLVDAANYFEKFLGESGVKRNSRLRKTASRHLRRLDKKLARVTITSKTVGTHVFIDAKDLGLAPIKNLRFTPGLHEAVLEKAGYARKVTKLNLKPGKHETLEFVLRPLPPPPPAIAAVAPPPAPPSTPDLGLQAVGSTDREEDDDAITSKWWFWTLVVGGAAVAAGATALAVNSAGGDFELPAATLGDTTLSSWEPVSGDN